MYWGKVVGTLAGLATLKPPLALLGFILGHQFDRGFERRYRSFESRDAGTVRVGSEFVAALFSCMGHVAKASGRVSEDEIRAARRVMHRLGLGPADVRRAIASFDAGKSPSFAYRPTLAGLADGAARGNRQRALFVRLLLEVAFADGGFRQAERGLVWQACAEFGISRVELAQLEAMIRAQKSFRHSPAGDADAARLRAAYATLGVATDASNEEIKRAYRRMMNRHHPDKIAASDPDAAAVSAAERATRDVRKAYELLKARRSIR